MKNIKENKFILNNIFISISIILLGVTIGILSAISPIIALYIAIFVAFLFILFLIFFKNSHLSSKRAIIPLLIASILLPPIRIPGGIPALRVELIIIISAWVFIIFGHFATGQELKIIRFPILKWFLFFGIAILFSISYGVLIKGFPLLGRDFWEFGKLLEYFLIFTFVANLDLSEVDIKHYYIFILVLFLVSAFFGFAQYFDFFNINTNISPYYAPTQMRGLLAHQRITGTTGNPNEFGIMMVFGVSIALAGILVLKKKRKKIFSWACFLFFILSIILTLSRSALISLSVVIIFLVLYKYLFMFGMKRWVKMLIIILPILIISFIIILNIAPEKFFFRIGGLSDIWSTTSLQARIRVWGDIFEIWKGSPIFGWGPMKVTMTTIHVDNEWLLLLTRYGIFGVTIFLLWFMKFYSGLMKIAKKTSFEEVKLFSIALQAILLACAVFMIPAGVYHSLQLMPILMILLGLVYSQKKKEV